MLTLKISEAEIQELKYERFNYPSPIVQKRMHVLYLKSLNKNHHQEISLKKDVHPNSVTNFIKIFNSGGFQAIKELDYAVPEWELMTHARTIEKEFEKHPPLSSQELGNRITTMTG